MHKNAEGGLDVLLSPAVKAKLEAIAKNVRPCGKIRRGQNWHSKRQNGELCGPRQYLHDVAEDAELRSTFDPAVSDQSHHELDEDLFEDDPTDDSSWDGDGSSDDSDVDWADDPSEPADGSPGEPADQGNYAQDEQGFYPVEEGPGSQDISVGHVIASEKDAEALGLALSGTDVAWVGGTILGGSLLIYLFSAARSEKGLSHAYEIPASSIQLVTKTRTKTTSQQSSTSSTTSACPTASPPVIESLFWFFFFFFFLCLYLCLSSFWSIASSSSNS